MFSSDAMSKERQLYRLNVWCTVRVESDLRTSKKIFYRRFDVSSFWENQLKKEMTFISEIKNKIRRTGMRNIYPSTSGITVFTQGILRSVKISTL